MPELPEVETVCRGLAVPLEGRRLAAIEVRRPDLRFPLPADLAARLAGRRVDRISRRAKYIRVFLDNGEVLVAHLGMSGRMTIDRAEDGPPPGKHDHVIFITDEGDRVRFCDPRRFGYMDLIPGDALDSHPYFAGLGPEPLGNEFNAPWLAARLEGRRSPIKAALLDQQVVSGLGNIYVCEALFHAGISPKRLAANVGAARCEKLVPAIKQVLERAIAAGGSSLRDYVQATGELGYFQHDWAVYGREGEPCPECPGTDSACRVSRITQSGRSSFYCTSRQR
ncbi:MAG: bifunctional DNA-formamidopyrimidine glycosylase/DNA-(apurinic or apyrimidinic site) lyase [Rhodospirillales bacterium]